MKPAQPPTLAFVGSVTTDDRRAMQNPAWSAAGCRWQLGFLEGLRDAGLVPDLVLSQEPARRFPASRQILRLPGRVDLAPGLRGRWIPFINLPVLRRLTAGGYVVLCLMFWGWRARKAESRTVVAYNLTEPPAWAVLTGARLARAVSVGLVADVNKPGEVVPAGFRWRFDYRWAVRLIRRFDRLITVREDIARKYAPGTPFLVVPGGVPARLVGRNPEPPAGHPPAGPFTVAFAGALTPFNGVALLLQAMALLEGEPFRLRIAGRGPLEAEVRAAAAVDGRVEYCGFLGADQVAALYEGASLLADVRVGRGMDPSRFFQGKLIEYMASGRPVLTTARGPSATADLVFRFEGTSGQELAATLRQLAAMPLEALAARAHAARQWVASEATWEAQGRRIREFLAGEGRLPVPRAG